MNKLSFAAMVLAVSVSAGASAQPAAAPSSAQLASYWHCFYQAEQNGGVFEFVQRGTCRLIINDPSLGRLTLFDAYFG